MAELLEKINDLNTNNPNMVYRLWVFGNHGWDVQYYSQQFVSFGKKLSIARNYDKWAIERVADSRILAQVGV